MRDGRERKKMSFPLILSSGSKSGQRGGKFGFLGLTYKRHDLRPRLPDCCRFATWKLRNFKTRMRGIQRI